MYLLAAIVYLVVSGSALKYFAASLINELPYWGRYVIWTALVIPFLLLCGKAYSYVAGRKTEGDKV